MVRLKELIDEYDRISRCLELHRSLLATLERVRTMGGGRVEPHGFEEVLNGEAKIIAIFDDRKRDLQQKIFE